MCVQPEIKIDGTTVQNQKIAVALRIIDEQVYSEGFRIATVADGVGCHPKYLSKLFKEKTGIGFFRYVERLRMRRACELLADAKMTSKEVAYACGWEPNYFSKRFALIVGQTPTEYRQRLGGGKANGSAV